MENPTPWAPLYRAAIQRAADHHRIPRLVLLAIAWQESHGGAVKDVGRWTWAPSRLYRFEPGFWDRYLAGKPEWAPPGKHPAVVEAWKRRVSASYGICQVMFPTAVQHAYGGTPESLLDPFQSAWFGARHLRHLLDGPAKGDLPAALAGYNTGRSRAELTTYDDEVLARLARLRAYADTGADPLEG